MKNTTSDFERIAIGKIPLIDVRAPIEFKKGAFLNTVNLPLMNDEERHLVGICYKEKGNEAAIKLGYQLVADKTRQVRIEAWVEQLNKYPNSFLYCFRGGLRSQISQQWIYEATGRKIPRIEGGYKAFRNYLLSILNVEKQGSIPILLGGYTGTGKTILLQKLENAMDLEGIAHHRGSSFGRHITSQPTQISFENNLAYALIQQKDKAYRYMVLEDEGLFLGRCFIPKNLVEYFASGHFVLLERPFEERVKITVDEYVLQSQTEYLKIFGEEQGLEEWFKYITESVSRVKKRLGGELFKRVMDGLELAYGEQLGLGTYHMHSNWIAILLKEYYDPSYDYQIKKAAKKVLFKGNSEEVLAYFKSFCSGKF